MLLEIKPKYRGFVFEKHYATFFFFITLFLKISRVPTLAATFVVVMQFVVIIIIIFVITNLFFVDVEMVTVPIN